MKVFTKDSNEWVLGYAGLVLAAARALRKVPEGVDSHKKVLDAMEIVVFNWEKNPSENPLDLASVFTNTLYDVYRIVI